MNKHRGWVASLSNGETVFETPNVPGERTAWGKLQEKCKNEGLWITQLQLQLGGKTIVGLKNADGYCHFFDFRAEGVMGGMVNGHAGREIHLRGIGSVMGDKVYCTLMNDQGQSWQDSRPLADMRVHCVLKPASLLAASR